MGFTIISDQKRDYTIIDNDFILNHINHANGNFVKIYLYILACHQNPELIPDLSICKLADEMECTEKDILRAIRFWEKEGILSCVKEDGNLKQVRILDNHKKFESEEEKEADKKVLDEEKSEKKKNDSAKSSDEKSEIKEKANKKIAKKQNYTIAQLQAFKQDEEIKTTIEEVEKIIGQVNKSYLNIIIYFICDLNFSKELAIEAFRVAENNEKTDYRYIEKIGVNWAKAGIKSLEEARDNNLSYSGLYNAVTRAFGLNRNLGKAEIEILEEWMKYNFDNEVIEKACSKALIKKGEINFNYVSGILKKWNEKGLKTIEDIERDDKEHSNKKRNSTEKPKKTKNQFQQFPQREYSSKDFKELEKQLLKG